jgi:sulfate permease, SulP family
MSPTPTSNYDGYVKGVAFGLINGIMVTPVMISFCTIIFRDAVYEPYLPSLVKLVLFSSAMHQLSFTVFSSLPFAVGQVQDAGLIFLSAMTSSVAVLCTEDTLLPTALFVLSIGTALLGVMLIVIGKLRLASVVQYLPMPVVGGYLAYIGFFCGQAGLAMMADVQVTSVMQWGLFCDGKAILLLLPGLFAGVSLYVLVVNLQSPYTLPASMCAILTLFYLSLWITGTSLDEAREFGWISPVSEPGR